MSGSSTMEKEGANDRGRINMRARASGRRNSPGWEMSCRAMVELSNREFCALAPTSGPTLVAVQG